MPYEIHKMKRLQNVIDVIFAAILALAMLAILGLLTMSFEAAADEIIFVQIEEPVVVTHPPASGCASVSFTPFLAARCNALPPLNPCAELFFPVQLLTSADNGGTCAQDRIINSAVFFAPRAKFRTENPPGAINPIPCGTPITLERQPSVGNTSHTVGGLFPMRGEAAGRTLFEVRLTGETGLNVARLAFEEVTQLVYLEDDGGISRIESFPITVPHASTSPGEVLMCDEFTVQAQYGSDLRVRGLFSFANTAHTIDFSLTAAP